MKTTLKALFVLTVSINSVFNAMAQTPEDFDISIQEITLDDIPGLHSFVHASFDNKWLLIGGRTDGLHQRQPFNAFLASYNNVLAYVIDPTNNMTYSAPLNTLPQAVMNNCNQRTCNSNSAILCYTSLAATDIAARRPITTPMISFARSTYL